MNILIDNTEKLLYMPKQELLQTGMQGTPFAEAAVNPLFPSTQAQNVSAHLRILRLSPQPRAAQQPPKPLRVNEQHA
jgi:hypothetical protein